jgi:glycosyltransferase involved in cell wall biosynthesis
MLKVAQVITRIAPGGAANILAMLANGAAERYKVTVFSGPEDADEARLDSLRALHGVRIVVIPELVRAISPASDFKAWKRLTRAFRSDGFDVVHTHTSKAGFLGRMAAAEAGVATIIHTPHGTIHTRNNKVEGLPRNPLGMWALKEAEKLAGRHTTWLTALSEHERDVCVSLGLSRSDNTVVIPNGIDVDEFSAAPKKRRSARKDLEVSTKEIVLLSLGRLSREKGVETLVEAFGAVAEAVPEARLIVAGDGPEKQRLLKTVAALDEAGKLVSFPGNVDNPVAAHAAADIFVMPSFYEGFGLSAVEAMASGTPVVASSVGGLPELLSHGKCGVLVRPGRADELAAAIISLSRDSRERKRLAAAGRKRSKDFPVSKMLESYFNLYERTPAVKKTD